MKLLGCACATKGTSIVHMQHGKGGYVLLDLSDFTGYSIWLFCSVEPRNCPFSEANYGILSVDLSVHLIRRTEVQAFNVGVSDRCGLLPKACF